MAWQRGVVVWACAIHQYHVNGTNTVSRLVSWSVDARGPVNHTSVGLAQARPNNHVSMEKGNVDRVCYIFSTISTISPVVKQLQTSGENQALPTCIITRAETVK